MSDGNTMRTDELYTVWCELCASDTRCKMAGGRMVSSISTSTGWAWSDCACECHELARVVYNLRSYEDR